MAWTEDRVELLKKLWAEGLSASQIANRLGDATRNAVIGKVHRLGLSGRATTSRIKSVRPRKRAAATRRVRPTRFVNVGGGGHESYALANHGQHALEPTFELAEELDIPLEERKSIATLKECNCRWPIGDPTHEDFYFCGRDKVPGMPYCEFHARKAFQPVQARRGREREERKLIATA